VARIPLGKSVRTSFLHVQCVILLGGKKEERRSWVEVSFFLRFSLYQCTGELRVSACGRASEECSEEVRTINIRIRPRGPREPIYNVSKTGRTMHSTNNCHWAGAMSVDGLVFVEISQITFGSWQVQVRVLVLQADAGQWAVGMCSQCFQSLSARCSVVRDMRAQKFSLIHHGLPGQ
jgi:hypothetical protein